MSTKVRLLLILFISAATLAIAILIDQYNRETYAPIVHIPGVTKVKTIITPTPIQAPSTLTAANNGQSYSLAVGKSLRFELAAATYPEASFIYTNNGVLVPGVNNALALQGQYFRVLTAAKTGIVTVSDKTFSVKITVK